MYTMLIEVSDLSIHSIKWMRQAGSADQPTDRNPFEAALALEKRQKPPQIN